MKYHNIFKKTILISFVFLTIVAEFDDPYSFSLIACLSVFFDLHPEHKKQYCSMQIKE